MKNLELIEINSVKRDKKPQGFNFQRDPSIKRDTEDLTLRGLTYTVSEYDRRSSTTSRGLDLEQCGDANRGSHETKQFNIQLTIGIILRLLAGGL